MKSLKKAAGKGGVGLKGALPKGGPLAKGHGFLILPTRVKLGPKRKPR